MTNPNIAALLLCTCATLLSCSKTSAPQSTTSSAGNQSSNAGSAGSGSGGASAGSTGIGGTTAVQGGAGTAGSSGHTAGNGNGGTPAGGTAGTDGSNAGEGGTGGMGMPGPPFGHPSPIVSHPQYDGFTLWVVEDFDEPLDLDTDLVWTWSDGGFDTHRFTRDAIGFEPGVMTITLDEVAQEESCSHSNYGIVPARTRTSGELRSRYNTFRYGRYEMSFKAPTVQPNDAVINGNYIASLFIYRQPSCQEWREIDLEVTGDGPTHLSTNLLYSNQDCNWSPDKEQVQAYDLPDMNFRTGFHTVGFEWLPTTVRFYTIDATGMETTLRTLTDRVPELPAKIMANLWVFSDTFAFGGPEGANNMYPMQSAYDFIRFYKWNEDMDYPCPSMDASCLAATDTDLAGNNGCDGIDNSGDLTNCMQCGTTVHVACSAECN